MGQRDQWDTYWGSKKIIFLIRDIDGPAMTAASIESCQSVAPRSPWVRSGMVLDVRKRLRRMRGRFHRYRHMRQFSQPAIVLEPKSPRFSIQSSLESTKRRRMRRSRLPDTRPIPEGVQEPSCIRKK